MRSIKSYSISSILLYSLFTLLIFTACENSVSDDHDEHEPVGLVIYSNSVAQLTQDINGTVTGNLSVDSAATAEFTIFFLDEEGDEFTPEPAEHSTNLSLLSGSENVSLSSGNDPFNFSLNGLNSGQASMSVVLLHEGAEEFVSLSLPVVVN